MTEEEIYNLCIRDLERWQIERAAERDCEKPLGVMLTYLRDRFGIPKAQGFPIAEKVLNTFGF